MATITIAGRTILVDDDDFDRLSGHRWYIKPDSKTGRPYVVRNARDPVSGKKRAVSMHKEVMGVEFDRRIEVDHRDHTATLDNRKQNLRICTRSQNNCNRGMRRDNTSGVKGVSLDPHKPGFWKAQIMHNKKAYNLGSFKDKEEAAKVYRDAAMRMHGEFALAARSDQC